MAPRAPTFSKHLHACPQTCLSHPLLPNGSSSCHLIHQLPAPLLVPSFRFILMLVLSICLKMYRTLNLLGKIYKGLLSAPLSLTFGKLGAYPFVTMPQEFQNLYQVFLINLTGYCQLHLSSDSHKALIKRRKNCLVTVKRMTVSSYFLYVLFWFCQQVKNLMCTPETQEYSKTLFH